MKKNDKIMADAPVLAEATDVALTKKSVQPEKEKRRSRRPLMNLLFVVSIIFIMISLTYSWFSSSNSAIADGAALNLADANSLEPGGLRSDGIIHSIAGDGVSFFQPILKKDIVATQGNYNLYQTVKGEGYNPLEDDVTTETALAKNLFVQDFTLTISGNHNIYLVHGTGIKAKDVRLNYLEGAIRVGVMRFNAETEKYELCLVWVPDVTSKKGGEDELDGKITVVSPNGTGASEEKITVNAEHGEAICNGVKYVWGKIDEQNEHNVLIGELNGTGKYRCVIWLDGNDRECNNELLNADITAIFKFYPEPVSNNATE